jgi:formate-dependent nitrite reductase membrane component NrfD
MSADNLSVIQHDVYHSIQDLVHVVTIASSMLLVHRLENCKPADNSQESLLKTMSAVCWIGTSLMLIRAFIMGLRYTKNNPITNNNTATHGIRIAMHITMSVLAILNLTYLSKTNINICTNLNQITSHNSIVNSSPSDMHGLVTWIVILSTVVLISNFKHLIWMIGTLSPVKNLTPVSVRR